MERKGLENEGRGYSQRASSEGSLTGLPALMSKSHLLLRFLQLRHALYALMVSNGGGGGLEGRCRGADCLCVCVCVCILGLEPSASDAGGCCDCCDIGSIVLDALLVLISTSFAPLVGEGGFGGGGVAMVQSSRRSRDENYGGPGII
jgi:hypothetical protein